MSVHQLHRQDGVTEPAEYADLVLTTAVNTSIRILRGGAGTGFYRRRRAELLFDVALSSAADLLDVDERGVTR